MLLRGLICYERCAFNLIGEREGHSLPEHGKPEGDEEFVVISSAEAKSIKIISLA